MKQLATTLVCSLILCAVSTAHAAARQTATPRTEAADETSSRTRVAHAMSALPMRFEPNVGQTSPEARFVARGEGYALFLTTRGAVLALSGAGDANDATQRGLVVRTRFEGSSGAPRLAGETALASTSNYFVGDRSTWRSDVPNFASVRSSGIYPGVDAIYAGSRDELSCSLEVAPGADVSHVALRVEGVESIEPTDDGGAILHAADGDVRVKPPTASQKVDGGTSPVAAALVVREDGALGLRVAATKVAAPIAIATVFSYSTFLRGHIDSNVQASARSVAIDAAGATYVTGTIDGLDIPTTNAYDATTDSSDAFVTKFAPSGTTIEYSTYLGGSGIERALAIAVTSSGEACVAGDTNSADFPTANAAQPVRPGGDDVFVARLAPSGSALETSTYVGGSNGEYVGPSGDQEGRKLALDAAGNMFVTGWTFSTNFPTTTGAYQTVAPGMTEAFVAKIPAAGGAYAYATYLGGTGGDLPGGIAVDADGAAYVVGQTSSADFPTPNGFDTSLGFSTNDAFVAKLSSSGASLVYGSYLGGSGYEVAHGVAVDAAGKAYVCGTTTSTDFPTVGALDASLGGSGDAFVSVVAASGSSLVSSTYLGGASYDDASAIALGADGAIYVAGYTGSLDFPIQNALDATLSGVVDAFVTKLAPGGASIVYSTFLGGASADYAFGLTVDATGRATIVGATLSLDFPVANAFDSVMNGSQDGFVTRLSASGGALDFSTHIGGTAPDNGDSYAHGIAVDADGAAYVVGTTRALKFPVVGAYDSTYNGETDVFVTKFSPIGTSLNYSTYVGGSGFDEGAAIAVDPAGSAYITGRSSSGWPEVGTLHLGQGGGDAYVAKLAPAGNALAYSVLVGGSASDGGSAIAVDDSGAAYVGGSTLSSNFPTSNAYSPTFHGVSDGFVLKMTPNGASLVFATYLGGSSADSIDGIATTSNFITVVVGSTESADFPTVTPVDSTLSGASDAFVARIGSTGASLESSTYLGGSADDSAAGVAVDASDAVYVAGTTTSNDFPTTGSIEATRRGGTDAFTTKLAPGAASIVYSTYLGGAADDSAAGVDVDASGHAYVSGETASSDFPTSNATDVSANGGRDAFVSVVNPSGSSLDFSTYFGGSGDERCTGVAVSEIGAAYIVGSTVSADFPTISAYDGLATGQASFVARFSAPPPGVDTPGVYVGATGAWFLRDANAGGGADTVFTYGAAGSGAVAIRGDWDGSGDDTPGLYFPSTGAFFLRDDNSAGGADSVFVFGAGGASVVPLSGDWDGDGVDTVGLYNAATGVFFLKNTNGPGGADLVFAFGGASPGALVPLAGDWNGDGVDTVGLYVPSTGVFFLKNANAPGGADTVFAFGAGGATPLVGDWNGDRVDTVGLYIADSGTFFLKNANAPGGADLVFGYGPPNARPLTGDWNGL